MPNDKKVYFMSKPVVAGVILLFLIAVGLIASYLMAKGSKTSYDCNAANSVNKAIVVITCQP